MVLEAKIQSVDGTLSFQDRYEEYSGPILANPEDLSSQSDGLDEFFTIERGPAAWILHTKPGCRLYRNQSVHVQKPLRDESALAYDHFIAMNPDTGRFIRFGVLTEWVPDTNERRPVRFQIHR